MGFNFKNTVTVFSNVLGLVLFTILKMKSKIFSLPQAELEYFPHFLKTEKANLLFEKLLKEVSWQQQNIKLFGKEIPQPRLTAFFAEKGISLHKPKLFEMIIEFYAVFNHMFDAHSKIVPFL